MRPRTPPLNASGNGVVLDEERERERDREREKDRGSLGGHRKKGMGVRAWLMIDPTGRTQLVEAGKHAIMRRACLPARDLRILDPLLSYPSTILGRERAIVLNLEHIKAIITAQEVLLLNSKDPQVVPVVLDLQRRLPLHFNSLGQQVAGDGGGNLSDEGDGHQRPAANSPAEGMSRVSSNTSIYNPQTANAEAQFPFPNVPTTSLQSRALDFRIAGASPSRAVGGPSALPFEFRALEVCLEAACSCLDAETTMLEREAYPALDELTSKLSTLNLERVRQIKARLVAISGRVQKIRDEIEQLLDDDRDMAEMYLTEKLMLMQEEGSTTSTSSHDHSNPMSPNNFEEPGRRLQSNSLQLQKSESFKQSEAEADNERFGRHSQPGLFKEISMEMEHSYSPLDAFKKTENRSSSTSSSTTTARGKLDVEELEMLLEAYFVQIDGTINKLSALREYVDDTEDYINIMLDDKQNHLLQMGVMLTTATLVVSAFIVVTGIFGMNIQIDLFDDETTNTPAFSWVVGASLGGCILIYVSAIAWCKFKRLIE